MADSNRVYNFIPLQTMAIRYIFKVTKRSEIKCTTDNKMASPPTPPTLLEPQAGTTSALDASTWPTTTVVLHDSLTHTHTHTRDTKMQQNGCAHCIICLKT